jgi:thiosulfate dehydrogenase [quinone] large subunit
MERKIIALTQAVVGYEWLSGGFEKLKTPSAVFAKELVGMIGKFASENPHGFYKNFLLNTVIPNNKLFSFMIPWGEFLGGLVLVVCAITLFMNIKNKYLNYLVAAALAGLVFMNINFWFAAGWMSPSTAGLNLVMGLLEAILLFGWLFVFNKSSKK